MYQENELKLLDKDDMHDIETRAKNIEYGIDDCYTIMKFLDFEIQDMKDQMENIKANDIDKINAQNDQFKLKFTKENLKNKIAFFFYDYYMKNYE